MLRKKLFIFVAMFVAFGILFVAVQGCAEKKEEKAEKETKKEEKLSGTIKGDGSSTVFPITEAVAEEFQKENPDVRVTVGISGTGGGFEKFTRGEIDVVDASRPIKDEEKELAAKNGVEYFEFKVAYDGLSVLVNPKNKFVKSLTVAELKKIWEPESKVSSWKNIRPEWPDEKIILFGPGTDSGTFDYFTKEIVGKEGASRSDYTASEDDNILVEGVASEEGSLGYFGYAYYSANKDKLKLVAIDGGKGSFLPSEKTIRSGEYFPLSRPLFIYVTKEAFKRTEVKEFVQFFLGEELASLVKQVGYVPLLESELKEEQGKLEKSQ
ncbi:MAG: PstS family phosphate ABC transporter substrate-binding protein [Actinobacteria bacterium]|nr:PstS family phosphate ABC transporter substrate-binding protein [Actinomycetota bacterium]